MCFRSPCAKTPAHHVYQRLARPRTLCASSLLRLGSVTHSSFPRLVCLFCSCRRPSRGFYSCSSNFPVPSTRRRLYHNDSTPIPARYYRRVSIYDRQLHYLGYTTLSLAEPRFLPPLLLPCLLLLHVRLVMSLRSTSTLPCLSPSKIRSPLST